MDDVPMIIPGDVSWDYCWVIRNKAGHYYTEKGSETMTAKLFKACLFSSCIEARVRCSSDEKPVKVRRIIMEESDD